MQIYWNEPGRAYNAKRSLYQQCLQRADYFTWAACKGFAPTGNDHETGRPRRDAIPADRQLGRAMNTGAARMYLRKARELRASMNI